MSMRSLFPALLVLPAGCALDMPGESFRGPLPALTPAQSVLAAQFREDVEALASDIGERNLDHPERLRAAEEHLAEALSRAGYVPRRHVYEVKGVECANLEAELPGIGPDERIIVIGAHYDSPRGSPGANDNASGVAAVLALARDFAGRPQPCTLRFVLFVNEEPPWFWTERMGSLVYARAARRRDEPIVAMLSLETIGYYSDQPGSQSYPPPLSFFYPDRGDFIAFVGMFSARALVRRCIGTFRERAPFPSQGAALTSLVPRVAASDHWSFWKVGYPALMVTDTAPYRYPHYHEPTDTPERLDYERMARVVEGVREVVIDLAKQ